MSTVTTGGGFGDMLGGHIIIVSWSLDEDSTTCVKYTLVVDGTEAENFDVTISSDWRSVNAEGPVPNSWFADYYTLGDQERRDKHGGKFEHYRQARRAAEGREAGQVRSHGSDGV